MLAITWSDGKVYPLITLLRGNLTPAKSGAFYKLVNHFPGFALGMFVSA